MNISLREKGVRKAVGSICPTEMGKPALEDPILDISDSKPHFNA